MAIGIPGVLGLAAVATLVLSTCHHEPSKAVQQAQAQAAIATANTGLARSSAVHADRAAQRVAQSQAVADQAEDEVRHAPSASDPVDPGLRGAVLAGMHRMCLQSDSAGTPACDTPALDHAVPAS